MTVDAFQHDCVLVCNGLPNSISNGLSLEEHEPINLENAKKDHQVMNYDFLKLFILMVFGAFKYNFNI